MSGTIIHVSNNGAVEESYYTYIEDAEKAFKEFIAMTEYNEVSTDFEDSLTCVVADDNYQYDVEFCYVDSFTQIS